MTPTKPAHPFLKTSALGRWDKSTIAIYTVLTICTCYLLYIHPPYDIKPWITFFGFGTPLFLYFFNYRSLRKLYVFLFWCSVSMLHLYLYFHFKDNILFDYGRSSALLPFRNTLILLVLFQLLRWLSRTTSGLELVGLSKSEKDVWNERKTNTIDVLCFFVFFAVTIFLDTYE
jgi:hypothetical protein